MTDDQVTLYNSVPSQPMPLDRAPAASRKARTVRPSAAEEHQQILQPIPVPEPTPEQIRARTALRHAVADGVMSGLTFADLHDELRKISSRMYAARIGKRS